MLLMDISRAAPGDLAAVESLLEAAGLPLEGARDAFETGVVARDGEDVVGAAAIEPHGGSALLRSVVVRPERRGTGLGRALVEAVEQLAADAGAGEVYLLTETAVDWFPRLGYRSVARDEVPAAISSSVEFTTACADTAVVMRRTL
jgi:amino-acid N-acetyltransferase